MAKTKSGKTDLEKDGEDERDPRVTGWPCMNNHKPGKAKGNQYGKWVHCETCGLRLEYLSKDGCTGQYRSAGPRPAVIKMAQQELIEIPIHKMNKYIMQGKIEEIQGRIKQERRPPKAKDEKPAKGFGKGKPSRESARASAQASAKESSNSEGESPAARYQLSSASDSWEPIEEYHTRMMVRHWRSFCMKLLYPPPRDRVDLMIGDDMSET